MGSKGQAGQGRHSAGIGQAQDRTGQDRTGWAGLGLVIGRRRLKLGSLFGCCSPYWS